ncbi:MAG: Gfo/Idh/MocA family protein [Anaerolineae bacterium]
MGKGHAGWIDATPGLRTMAVCDATPARIEAARRELPALQAYCSNLDELLQTPDLDLVVNILPHNLHASMTIKCLEAGKHVVLEKPFCITIEEANAMIAAAQANGVMLSLFHNRRWDGDYVTIKDIIRRGLIGDVFHVECGGGNYDHPGFWWRSDKTISGGVMYDWGAHFIDWILNLVPSRVAQVMGDMQKRVWHMVSNEDHGEAWIRFENGVTADYLTSSIAASSRPKWRILGTKGAIEADWGPEIRVVSYASGLRQDSTVKVTLPGYGSTEYYRNVADHLLMGEELAVTPEQARRVIGIIDAAQRSAELGTSVAPADGCD